MRLARILFCLGVLTIGMSSSRLGGLLTISDLFFALSLCVWFLCGLPGLMRRSVIVNAFSLGALLVLAGACLALVRSEDLSGSIANIVKFGFVLVISFIEGPALFMRPDRYFDLIASFGGSVIINLIGALVQLQLGTNLFGVGLMSGRLTGFSEHPNELGLHCALGIVVGVVIWRLARTSVQRMFGIATVLAGLLGMTLSASMTAIAATGVALIFVALYELWHGRTRLLLLVSGLLLVTGMLVVSLTDVTADNFFLRRILSTQDSDLDDTTLGTRIRTYQIAIAKIAESPLIGVGGSELDATIADGYKVHNIFLLGLFQGGLLQFGGLLLIYIECGRLLWKARRRWGDQYGLLLFVATLFIVLCVCVSLAPVSIRRVAWLPFAFILIPLRDISLRAAVSRWPAHPRGYARGNALPPFGRS
jgi:O-antigen ligase